MLKCVGILDAMGLTGTPTQLDAITKDWESRRTGLLAEGRWEVVVRVDRSISWLRHAQVVDGKGVWDADSSLVFNWIALNALFSKKRSGNGSNSERELIRVFVGVLANSDAHLALSEFLDAESNAGRVRAIASDGGLDADWWEAMERPTTPPPRDDSEVKRISREKMSGEVASPIYRLLKRVYVARCQLVHGGACCNSQLNREAIEPCNQFLRAFVLLAIRIIMNEAWKSDWSGVLYPPPDSKMSARGSDDRPRRGRTPTT